MITLVMPVTDSTYLCRSHATYTYRNAYSPRSLVSHFRRPLPLALLSLCVLLCLHRISRPLPRHAHAHHAALARAAHAYQQQCYSYVRTY